MTSGYEDKTGFVECEFRVSVGFRQRKVPDASDMSTARELLDLAGYQSNNSYNLRENPW